MSTSGPANYVLLTRLADEFAARYRAGERQVSRSTSTAIRAGGRHS